MQRAEFADLVARTRRERPHWFDLEPDAVAGTADIEAVEHAVGARLPDDYSWFLTVYGGGDIAFARIYSADAESDLYLPGNQGPAGHVAFADNGTGDLFVLPIHDGVAEDRVLLHDHETGRAEPTDYAGFLDFVAREALRA